MVIDIRNFVNLQAQVLELYEGASKINFKLYGPVQKAMHFVVFCYPWLIIWWLSSINDWGCNYLRVQEFSMMLDSLDKYDYDHDMWRSWNGMYISSDLKCFTSID